MPKVFSKKQFHKPKFIKKPSAKVNLGSKTKAKKMLFIILTSLILAGLIYLIAYSPIFKIRTISISGTNETEIINKVQIITDNHTKMWRFFVIPNNLIFLNKEKLADQINKDLKLETLIIEKKFLSTLKITATEKTPALIWRDSRDNYYVDKEGYVMTAILLEEVKYDLPLASRGTTSQATINTQVISRDNIKFITQVANRVKSIFKNWQIKEVVATTISNKELHFYTNQGWYIILNTELEVDKPINNLEKLINQKIENTNELKYIDLRIEDRIFYK